ncbi:general odorant-binding protein 19d-like [Battus philenor]|uniref:general odorant-binding protein 19d-like n=1 Tax=Battus philenor TaxID=42288 RepID=UPI0035D07FB2
MLFLQFVLCSCVIGVSLARTEAEVKAYFLEQSLECHKEHPVTKEEIDMLNKHQLPDSMDAKCLLACVYRRTTWMDEKGMFVAENAYKLSQEKHPDDTTKLENSKKLFDLCKEVNEETVSDGEKGCERAGKLTKCLTENAPKLGFQLE